MSDKRQIAVIGGGIFGTTLALKLAARDYRPIVFERDQAILRGASHNNQNRLHLGYHYPRDLETALQSRRGYQRFCDTYPESISRPFPNAYYIANEGSLTTPEAFLGFCERAGLPYSVLSTRQFPVQVNNTALGIAVSEAVYDSRALRRIICDRLAETKVRVRTSTEVLRVDRKRIGYSLYTAAGESVYCDGVVNCSYADINRVTHQLGYGVSEQQYEYTVIPIVKCRIPRVGVTIMDGPFMTFLPFGHSEQFLLYHVKYTVVEQQISTMMPDHWRDPGTTPFARLDKEELYNRMIDACAYFVPDLKRATLVGFLHGPRMVLAKSDDTDARPSIIREYDGNYMTVFSGKVDHAVWIAEEVVARVVRNGRCPSEVGGNAKAST